MISVPLRVHVKIPERLAGSQMQPLKSAYIDLSKPFLNADCYQRPHSSPMPPPPFPSVGKTVCYGLVIKISVH